MPGSSKWSLSLRFPHQNPVYTSTLSICATCPAYLILLYLITRTIMSEDKSLSSSLCSFLHSLITLCLSHKYSPQHPILKHPQPTFLPQCDKPSSTPIQHNSPNYSSIYLDLFLFGQQTGRQNILDRITAGTS